MPWDPVRDLLTMQERLESLFGRAHPGWVPPADLSECADRYVLTIELPGLKRQDIKIDVRDGTVTVHGQRPGQECSPERYQQLERGQGQFARSFQVPRTVDGTRVAADLVEGVLTVVLPKLAEDEARRIVVE